MTDNVPALLIDSDRFSLSVQQMRNDAKVKHTFSLPIFIITVQSLRDDAKELES